MSIDQALQHGRPFRFSSVDSTDYNAMIFGDPEDNLEAKPVTIKQTDVIETKGYAAAVKNGKPEQPQTTTASKPKPTPEKTSMRKKSKDKKTKKGNSNNGELKWVYHSAEKKPQNKKGNQKPKTNPTEEVVYL